MSGEARGIAGGPPVAPAAALPPDVDLETILDACFPAALAIVDSTRTLKSRINNSSTSGGCFTYWGLLQRPRRSGGAMPHV